MVYLTEQGKHMFQESFSFSMENPYLPRANLPSQEARIMVKGQWTPEEDQLLVSLVSQFGIKRWSHVAKMLRGRVGKQCRERWFNHLRPDIKKEAWTTDEEIALVQAHSKMGNKWAEIAKRIPGRPENSIKNHWNATCRRMSSKRRWQKDVPNRGNGKGATSVLEEYVLRLKEAKEREARKKEAEKQLKGKNIEESTQYTLSQVMADQYQQKENHAPYAFLTSEYVNGGVAMLGSNIAYEKPEELYEPPRNLSGSVPSWSNFTSLPYGSGLEDLFGGFAHDLLTVKNDLDLLQIVAARATQ